ncbi:MAG: InlB B-repeat-containing protein [Actinomycetes bacterium]|nr:InlB B-repeat-containing protein [Actinomycetes bacterium]
MLGNFSLETSPLISLSETLPIEGKLTSANKTEVVCTRCHPLDSASAPSLLRRSVHWQKVSFDSQGGTTPIPVHTYLRSGKTYGKLATVTKDGHDFKGWYTEPEGQGSLITSSTVSTITSDQTLYAFWESAGYRVSYNGNGASGGSAVFDLHLYDATDEATAAVNTWQSLGMDFVAWNTLSNGAGTSYHPGDSLVFSNGNLTLYAIWKKQALSFEVTIGSDLTFAIPTSGFSDAGTGQAPYAWDIDWGVGSPTEAHSTSSSDSAGVSHTYPNAGTYTIKITPQGTPSYGWARAFAFGEDTDGANSNANKKKVTAVTKIPTLGFLAGSTSAGSDFMRNMWYGCTNLESVAFNDSTDWSSITTIGNSFLANTWNTCTNLTTADVPDTSSWQVSTIGNSFLANTWQDCDSLAIAVVPKTSNWTVTTISSNFLANTWSTCTDLTTADVPDTSNWKVDTIGNNFLFQTWYFCTSLTTAVVPNTSNWKVTTINNFFLSQTWDNCAFLAIAAVPNTSNWTVNTIGSNFLASTWNTCTNLTTADVPDTSNWTVKTIGSNFLASTWNLCSKLTPAVVPNTSNWTVNTIGNNFLANTWRSCSELIIAVVPNTSNWKVTTIGTYFLVNTWYSCGNLITAVVPDTSGWPVTAVGNHFLTDTWYACTSLPADPVLDTSGWQVTPPPP